MKFRLTIGKQLTLTCATLIVLAASIACVALYNINTADTSIRVYADDAMPGMYHAGEIQADIMELRGNSWEHIASSDAGEMAEIERSNDEITKRVMDRIRGYEAAITQDDDRRRFSEVRVDFERYTTAWTEVLPVSRQGKNQEAAEMYMRILDPRYRRLHSLIRE